MRSLLSTSHLLVGMLRWMMLNHCIQMYVGSRDLISDHPVFTAGALPMSHLPSPSLNWSLCLQPAECWNYSCVPTTPGLCSAGDQIQGFVHAQKLSYSPGPFIKTFFSPQTENLLALSNNSSFSSPLNHSCLSILIYSGYFTWMKSYSKMSSMSSLFHLV